jgi:hypothetical protein
MKRLSLNFMYAYVSSHFVSDNISCSDGWYDEESNSKQQQGYRMGFAWKVNLLAPEFYI